MHKKPSQCIDLACISWKVLLILAVSSSWSYVHSGEQIWLHTALFPCLTNDGLLLEMCGFLASDSLVWTLEWIAWCVVSNRRKMNSETFSIEGFLWTEKVKIMSFCSEGGCQKGHKEWRWMLIGQKDSYQKNILLHYLQIGPLCGVYFVSDKLLYWLAGRAIVAYGSFCPVIFFSLWEVYRLL